jgi:chemotaxis methyl-accepting protein methylase
MRTTLDLPESLIKEAMAVTHISTKTEVIKTALEQMIRKEKIAGIKSYFGKLNLELDLDQLRNR